MISLKQFIITTLALFFPALLCSSSLAHAALLSSVTVGPGQRFTEPALAIPFLAPKFNMTILPGTYYIPFDIPPNMGPFTMRGAGKGRTIINGRGGAGAGYRLSWGKGCIHTRSPGRISSIVFTNCGGADQSADGEAGVYAENFNGIRGTVYIDRCLFLKNENGIFVPSGSVGSPGFGVSTSVTNTDFVQNGQSLDGYSHDVYVQGPSYAEANCNHYGNPYGNNIKVRSPRLTVTGGFHHNHPGARWIDYPSGGTATILGGTFAVNSSSLGGNIIGYGEENKENGVKLGGMRFTNSKFYIGRLSYVNVGGGGSVRFVNVKVVWEKAGVSISVNGGGAIQGLQVTAPPAGTVFVGDPAPPPRVSGN